MRGRRSRKILSLTSTLSRSLPASPRPPLLLSPTHPLSPPYAPPASERGAERSGRGRPLAGAQRLHLQGDRPPQPGLPPPLSPRPLLSAPRALSARVILSGATEGVTRRVLLAGPVAEFLRYGKSSNGVTPSL
eukprot:1514076-Rhodomonas_salina.1